MKRALQILGVAFLAVNTYWLIGFQMHYLAQDQYFPLHYGFMFWGTVANIVILFILIKTRG